MKFFTGLLALWLMLFPLMSGAAWNTTECLQFATATAETVQESDSYHLHRWSEDRCEDHCGHASAHVMGVNTNGVRLVFRVGGKEVANFKAFSRYVVFLSPPYHPPIG